MNEINKSLINEISVLQESIKNLESIKFVRFNNEECWVFEDSDEDHLESLVCPVVISPKKLIEIISKARGYSNES